MLLGVIWVNVILVGEITLLLMGMLANSVISMQKLIIWMRRLALISRIMIILLPQVIVSIDGLDLLLGHTN